jgi:thiol-disulfide isomerase/thioredoxin
MKFGLVCLGISLCATLMNGSAADLGDAAPELKISKWVKSEPLKVAGEKSDKVYVVEFWATWCPPCRQSIPHLTELQKKFKDKVEFVGISDEEPAVVSKFVKQMADKMDYHVALDDDHKTSAGYMEAFKIDGIPHAFVVQKQKIIWQGHPMAGLGEALDDIVAGKYDVKKAKARAEAESLYEQFRMAAFKGENTQADELAAQLQKVAPDVKGIFQNDKFDPDAEKKQWRARYFESQFRRAVAKGEEGEAEEAAAHLKKLDPNADIEGLKAEGEINKIGEQYFKAITSSDPGDKVDETGSKLAKRLEGKPEIANRIAWSILDSDQIKHRDIPLALAISKRACEDSQWKKPQIVDTYARALFDSGKKQEAIEQQQKALALAEDDDMKKMFEETLRKYKEAKQ